jgi:hypothetical protein
VGAGGVALMLSAHAGVARGADTVRQQVSAFGAFGRDFVPGAWTPLRVTVTNGTGSDADGVVKVGPTGGTLAVEVPVWVPPHSRVSRTMFAPIYPTAKPDAKDRGAAQIPVRWETTGATRIADSDAALQAAGNTGDVGDRRGVILNFWGEGYQDEDWADGRKLAKLTSDVTGSPTVAPMAAIAVVPRNVVAYDACRVVMLSQVPVESLDEAQRQTLLDYVRSGGTLLVACPIDAGDPRGTWLEPYLPVRVVGQRLTSSIGSADGPTKLLRPLKVTEAVAVDGANVVMADGDAYVHAAWRQLGMGRVAFTSFAITAPTWSDDKYKAFYTDLLDLNGRDSSWASTSFAGERKRLTMQDMIGTPAPPRTVAVGIACGFVLLLVVAQGVWRGARRPVAFGVGSAVAVVTAAGLVGTWYASKGNVPLTAGRVTLTRLADGGGFMQELAAYTGSADGLSLTTSGPDVPLRPALYDQSVPPQLQTSPFAAPDADVAAGRIDRVWEAQAVAPAGVGATATGSFGENGLELSVDNAVGSTIEAPGAAPSGQRLSVAVAARRPVDRDDRRRRAEPRAAGP